MAPRLRDRELHALAEQEPVAETREPVVIREVADLLLRPPPLREILHGALESAWLPVGEPHHLELGLEEAIAAVGQPDAMVEVRARAALDARACEVEHRAAVVGVEPVDQLGRRHPRASILGAEQQPELPRSHQLARFAIELEASAARDLLRLRERGPAPMQLA